MKPPAIDLLFASANPLLTDGLGHLVRLGNFRIAGEARNVADLLTSLKDNKPAILILDLDLAVQQNDLIQKCRLASPGTKVALVEGNQVDPALSLEPQAADAFLNRKQSMATLVKSLEALSAGLPHPPIEPFNS